MRRVIEPTQSARRGVPGAAACRSSGRGTASGTRRDAGPFFELRPFLRDGGLRPGTWGFEIYDELGAGPEDWLVEKNRLSAFYNTNLELDAARRWAPRRCIIGGVLTNQCIAATSKDAMFRDFKPIVVEECAGTTLPHLHEPALEMVRVGWGEVRGLEATLADLLALAASGSGACRHEVRRALPARGLARLPRLGARRPTRPATTAHGSSTARCSGRTSTST